MLVCEDEAILRIWLRRELVRQGLTVIGEAQTGDEAVVKARELAPDLILMDIKLPGCDGLAASAQILKDRLTPIVILTAYGDAQFVQRALDIGVSGYLVKPVEAAQLSAGLSMAQARFAEMQRLREHVAALEDSLEQRKLVQRAKGVLERRLGIDEPAAHQLLQRLSSRLNLPLKSTALRIIASERQDSPNKGSNDLDWIDSGIDG